MLSHLELRERKVYSFSLILMCINVPLQGWDSCSGNARLLQVIQEKVYCASIKVSAVLDFAWDFFFFKAV